MSTRSTLIAKLANGQTKSIYCHWDGYPEHNGQILLDHYQDQTKIDELIALGDLSILNEEIGEKHCFDSQPSRYIGNSTDINPAYEAYQAKYGKMCLAYGRDRGETKTQARIVRSLSAAIKKSAQMGAEFVYYWNGQSWEITTPEGGVIHPLREFMKGGLSLVQTVKAFGGNFKLGKRIATAVK